MHLVQVCNVGNICGGTAACAWAVTRALPAASHTVVFLSPVTDETRAAFEPHRIVVRRLVDDEFIRTIGADAVLLHNTVPQNCTPLSSAFTLQYKHSAVAHVAADSEVTCSKWLADRLGGGAPVLYQAVPVPPQPFIARRRELERDLVVGRICTPTQRKWSTDILPLYERLSHEQPAARFEFVGAPKPLVPKLSAACRGRAAFYPAGFEARSRLWNWDVLLYHHPTMTESFGRTAAEAMRSGCVPIVDDRGGFREQITDRVTGFLCRTAGDFAAAMETVSDRSIWWTISRAARTEANRRFSITRFSLDLTRLIRDCLNR